MRLVCPNCDAEYEIDDAAIPKGGRDVQCSNCGHAWYQNHPEIEAEQEAEADLYDAPPGAVVHSAPEPEPEIVETPEPEPDLAGDEDGESVAVPKARSLDETVLAVLREEAERETAARQAETAPKPVIETQTEMPLVSEGSGMAAAVRRLARLRSGAEAAPVVAEPEPALAPASAPVQKSRSQLLPAIEEINSTLRATGDRSSDEDNAVVDSMVDLTKPKGGFRRGFITLVVLAVLVVVLYVAAPFIKAKVPALAGVMDGYVVAVDAARVWLDTSLRGLVATLRGYAGGQGG